MIQFSRAEIIHVPEINRLVNSVYRGDSSRSGWTTEADLLGGQRIDEERVKEIILTPDNVILLALHDQKIVACVHLEKKSEKLCYLGMLSVDAKSQSLGIGRKLMEFAEQFARGEWFVEKMEMTVIGQRTELINYYVRRGYKITGEKREFPKTDPRFGLPLRADLYFEVLEKNLKLNSEI